MSMATQQRLPPEVNRILYIRNLPFNISPEELYSIFGNYGGIRQIRTGVDRKTKGTAYVVYEDLFDAKRAQEGLNGFNVQNRYLNVLYWNQKRHTKQQNLKAQEAALKATQETYGVDGDQHARPAKEDKSK